MHGTSPIDLAMQRLRDALEALDHAVDHHVERDRNRINLEEDIQRVEGDRSRLAQSLDAAEARTAQLEEANREVSHRLVAAMESIRAVLARHAG
jgi:hypothetical protein